MDTSDTSALVEGTAVRTADEYRALDSDPEGGAHNLPTHTPEGLPINPATGQRYGMVERHPYTTGPRPGLCHLCNGAPDYIAHDIAGTDR